MQNPTTGHTVTTLIPGKDVFSTKGIDGNTGYVEKVNYKAAELYDLFNEFTPSTPEAARCFAIAKTNLEEGIMWATKGVSRSNNS